jgi:LmbE family N-acetylglucosaminyl deacetylase
LGHSQKQTKKQKVILAILAHPDDETAMAQVLAKYAKENKVYLIIATDGRYGVRDHAGIPAGDSLAEVRKKETSCASKILGLQPPIFFGFHDGMGIATNIGEFHKQTDALAEKVKQTIEELNPDIVISFGPDGDTGHSDHRHIGAITTQVILKEGWVKKYPLYFLAWSQKDSDKLKASIGLGLNTVSAKYFNLQIKFSQKDEDVALSSLDCYESQLTPKEIEEWKAMEIKDKKNTLYFRRLSVSKERKDSF